MMSEPVVLVITECKNTDLTKIINDIRNCPQDENVCEIDGKTGYRHSISSKYYNTNVVLYPFTEDLKNIGQNLQGLVEGMILYFDASDREFLKKLESYANFLEDRGIELGVLLCERVFDEASEGITYKEAKQFSRVLDLIELNPDNPSEGEPQGGYQELHVALRNTIWSNISMHDESKETKKSSDMSEKEIEEKLADFEKLLSQAVQFRSNTADLSRNERFLYAQQFADAFENIFGVESDDEDEEASSTSYVPLD